MVVALQGLPPGKLVSILGSMSSNIRSRHSSCSGLAMHLSRRRADYDAGLSIKAGELVPFIYSSLSRYRQVQRSSCPTKPSLFFATVPAMTVPSLSEKTVGPPPSYMLTSLCSSIFLIHRHIACRCRACRSSR